MKLLLIRPDHHMVKLSNRKMGIIHQPLGLMYLAAALEKAGHGVSLCDELVGDDSLAAVDRYQPDLVGITVTSPLFARVCELVSAIKQRGIKVILGGPHISALPRASIEKSGADGAVVGEGEETIVEIADGRNWADIAGLRFFRDGQWLESTLRIPPDVDQLPLPARHLLDRTKYLGEHEIGFHVGKRASMIRLFTSRGCPFHCTFCSSATVFGRVARYRSVEGVMDELRRGVREWNTRNVMFMDDTFTLKKNHAMQICEAIIREGLSLRWGCFSRAGISEELLKTMKRAGCHLLGFGVESGSPAVLQRLKKNITPAEIEESLVLCRKHGIRSKAFIMVGTPGETEEEYKQTLDLCLRARPDYLTVSVFLPLPGSEIMVEMTGDSLPPRTGSFFDSTDPVNRRRHMDLLWKFHCNPAYLLRFLKNFSFGEMSDYWYMLSAFLAVRRSHH